MAICANFATFTNSIFQEWNNVSLNPSLQLPVENEFIPTDFAIRDRPEDVSRILQLLKVAFKIIFDCL